MTALASTAIDAASPDPRDPVARLAALVDPGTLHLVSPPDDAGVVSARGRVDGAGVVVYCTDATVMGGALGLCVPKARLDLRSAAPVAAAQRP